ncbi:MAG: hypothetical protein D6696_06720 [Acidobacteria bacterium]|nr:MAG: hypothetical protein D6696_06720 [Acidobacteriota bacterium]
MSDPRSPSRQRLVEGSMLTAGVIVVLALYAMVNYLALRHYERFDWTASELYSLSEKTKNVIAGVDRDVETIIFLSPGSEVYDQVDELLSRYQAANPRITKRVVDPVRNPLEARQLSEQHGVERMNVVVVASGDDRRVIEESDLVEYDFSGAQFGQAPSIKAFKGEQLITSAILELIEDKKPKVLLLAGHGEASLDGGAQGRGLRAAEELLGKDNVALETWSSLGQSAVPADADLIIVAGPTARFLEPEIALFDDYLKGGGRMLFLLDPTFSENGDRMLELGLEEWLRSYGVELDLDVVIDPAQRLPLYGPETIFTSDYGFHPIVEPLAQTQTPVLLPLARSVRKAEDAPAAYEISELVKTSDQAWGETDLKTTPAKPDGDDPTGPLPLGLAVAFDLGTDDATAADDEPADDESADDESADDEPAAGDRPAAEEPAADGEDGGDEAEVEATPRQGRLVVYGDYDFASDAQVINGANAALLLNTLNWLIEREQLLAIPPRQPEQARLLLSQSELYSLYVLTLLLMPGAAIVAGILVYLRRRR